MTRIAGQLLRDDMRLMRELCVIDFRFWRRLRWLNRSARREAIEGGPQRLPRLRPRGGQVRALARVLLQVVQLFVRRVSIDRLTNITSAAPLGAECLMSPINGLLTVFVLRGL